MCGITGYVGPRSAVDVALDTLQRLEYRGYDSAGVAFWSGKELNVLKRAGKIKQLTELLDGVQGHGMAISHTRWATHGIPNDPNSHPHTNEDGRVAVVHNGIVENYLELRKELAERGHTLASDTDTEVFAHLIEEQLDQWDHPEQAVAAALKNIRGSYAIAVMLRDKPDRIIAAKHDSPLVMGLGEGENFLASDIHALLDYTRRVVILENGDIASLSAQCAKVFDRDARPVDRPEQYIDWSSEASEKGGYEHFMLKEINEQPQAVRDTLRGRLMPTGEIRFSEMRLPPEDWARWNRWIIVACGTAYHAGLAAKAAYEKWLRRPVETYFSSEFRYGDPILTPDTLAIFVSQSGETADTLAALRLCKEAGVTTIGVVNVVGSAIARECDQAVYTQAGPEISVASTKAYTTQLALLYLIGLHAARLSDSIDGLEYKRAVRTLMHAPSDISRALETEPQVIEIAKAIKEMPLAFYLGRGVDAYAALEGALKIKEIAYVPTQDCPAGEMKHGPLALIEPGVVAVFVATQDHTVEKILGNIKEVRARRGTVLLLTNEGDDLLPQEADHTIYLPKAQCEALSPLSAAPVLQLLAYHVARLRDCEIDQPRNLAKSVTVE